MFGAARTSLDVGTESSLTESILSKIGLKVPSETREQLILATVLVLFAGVFAARIFIDNVEQPAALLYALPITLIAVEYGARAGLLSAGVALALFAIYTNIREVDVTAVGWGSRAVVYFVLGGMLGLLSDRLRWAHAVVETSVGGNRECLYFSLAAGSSTFSSPVNFSNSPGASLAPVVILDASSTPVIVWSEVIGGGRDIVMTRKLP